MKHLPDSKTMSQTEMTSPQHKEYNELRLLKAAIKRNVGLVIGLLPRETQEQLIACETERERTMMAARHLEYESSRLVGSVINLAPAKRGQVFSGIEVQS